MTPHIAAGNLVTCGATGAAHFSEVPADTNTQTYRAARVKPLRGDAPIPAAQGTQAVDPPPAPVSPPAPPCADVVEKMSCISLSLQHQDVALRKWEAWLPAKLICSCSYVRELSRGLSWPDSASSFCPCAAACPAST